MSDDETRRRKPSLAGPNLKGKWFKPEKDEPPHFDQVDPTRLTTLEHVSIAPWWKRAWYWIRRHRRS